MRNGTPLDQERCGENRWDEGHEYDNDGDDADDGDDCNDDDDDYDNNTIMR